MSQQQLPPPSVGLLIGGIIVGVLLGGTVLTLLLFLLFGVAFSWTGNGIIAFIFCYAAAAGLGVWAFRQVRKGVDFASGFLIGLTAGLLGSTALCNAVTGGLSNMH